MKLLLIALFLLPTVAFGEHFKYAKVHVATEGNDNFNVSTNRISNVSGEIAVEEGVLKIDGVAYALEATDQPEVFKTKKGFVKLVYQGDQLAAVRVYRFAKVHSYIIEDYAVAVTR